MGSASRRPAYSFPGRVEVVVSPIGALAFGVPGAAGPGRWLSTLGMNSLDAGDTTQHAISGMTCGAHQQPGNRVSIRRVHPGHSFSCHLAAIGVFPGGPRVMSPNDGTLQVAKFRVRRLEDPGRLSAGSLLTGIDLNPGCV